MKMDCDDIDLDLSLVVITVGYMMSRGMRKRRWWERPHLGPVNRRNFSQASILDEMKVNDSELFFKYLRFTPDQFDKLLHLVGPSITHNCLSRETINPSTRMAITLRFLATGESQSSLALNYRLGDSTVHYILKETLRAIYTNLKPIYLPEPTEAMLKTIADGFWARWDVPNCVGSFDGKHIRIKKPYRCGSEFYNYKGYHSVILLASCDHKYKFTMADVGAEGRQSDGGVFQNSAIGKRLISNNFPMPPSDFLPNGPMMNYFFLADGAFKLTTFMITPFARSNNTPLPDWKAIFNYRQSRGRRVIENAFGIFVIIFRIFKTEIDMDLESIDMVILAAICLHNFRLEDNENNGIGISPTLVDRHINGVTVQGSWRQDYTLDRIDLQQGRRPIMKAIEIRNELALHFIEGGSVPWQYNIVD